MKRLLFLSAIFIYTTNAFSQCSPATAHTTLDINNVKARVMNGGDMWWDHIGSAKYEVPAGSGANALFAGALWIGGLDQNNELHTAAQTYGQNGNDYFPGPLNASGTVTSATCNSFDQMWQVYGSEIDSVRNLWDTINPFGTNNPIPPDQIPNNVLQWPAKGSAYNVVVGLNDLAPFFDRDGDGLYDPTQGDYPILAGCIAYADQMIWWIFNDNGNTHTESNGLPMGIEVQAMAYAFQTNDAINDQTFYRYKIINRSANTYHDVYAGLWVDPDLGCYIDDYIGCDTSMNMGIVYNADADDQLCSSAGSYGNQPPLIGIKILNGISSDTSIHLMSHFMFYNNDFTVTGNPVAAYDYYHYLKTIYKDTTHLTIGGTGYGGTVSTDYAFPSEPGTTGWSECAEQNTLADRRIIISSGPVTLLPGATVTMDYAVVFVQPPVGTYSPCPTFTMLQNAAILSQQWYDSGMCADTTVGVKSIHHKNFSLFPNPINSGSDLLLGTEENGKIELLEVSGRLLIQQTVTLNDNRISTNDLMSGCYLLRFTNHQGVSSFSKLIVQ